MAIGKVRPNKRSSGASYSSTLTTIIVLGLCVYGLWMLSANNVFSPGTTARTATATSAQSSSSTSHQGQSMKPISKKSQPIFEDSQGDLPEDAIKPDHESIQDDHKDEFSDLQKDPAAGDTTEDSEPETNDASESSSDNSNEAEENRDTGGNEEERNAQDKDSVVKENPQGLRGHESEDEKEKQKQAETQNSQESSLTRNQEAEKTTEKNTSEPVHKDVQSQEASKQITHDQDMGTQPVEKSSNNEPLQNQEIPGNKEHEISEEDQQKRLRQHQQQEDEQIQQGKQQEAEGATRQDQIKHDEKPSTPGGESSAIPKESRESQKAWSTQADESLQACMHRVPTQSNERGSEWPEEWPRRLQAVPYWLNKSQMGIYGKPAPEDFTADYEHWKQMVNKSYISGLGISWSDVRNVMDMRAVYGGFAAALKDLKVWVMNVVNVDSPDTLPIIYERGLFGIYHDWCESFSTYPRTYDLLHADHLFSRLKKRCKLVTVMTEVDRLVRPGGKFIMRDDSGTVGEVENLLKSLHWEVRFTFSKDKNGILSAQKSEWRPDSYVDAS